MVQRLRLHLTISAASIDSMMDAHRRRPSMAQLIVRNLSEDLVRALKRRAAKSNRSAEQEHREILRAALAGPRRRRLADVLSAMPSVGEDRDFAREQSDQRG